MHPEVRTFLAPKLGECREDCEDSIHPAPGEGAGGVLAVSDGTTTSFFSGLWARILTRRFAENPAAAFEPAGRPSPEDAQGSESRLQPAQHPAWLAWLKGAQQEWQEEVRRRAEAKDASFYMRNDVLGRKPAAATFVGLALDPPNGDGGIPWRALVLGDSCLFVLGKDGPRSMALTRAEEFSYLVKAAESYGTEDAYPPAPYGSAPHGSEPALCEGDSILLATDALSKWLLSRAGHGQPVWGTVLALVGEGDFETLIDQARHEADDPLENDDVALAIRTVGSPHDRYLESRFEPKPSNCV